MFVNFTTYFGRSFEAGGSKVKNIASLLSETKSKHQLIYQAFLGAIEGLTYSAVSAAIDSYNNDGKQSTNLGTVCAALAIAGVTHLIAKKTIVGSDCFNACAEGVLLAAPRILLPVKWLIPIVSIIAQLTNQKQDVWSRALTLYLGDTLLKNTLAPITLLCTRTGSRLIALYSSQRERPIVIFLNGTSSAGKTSIAKQIQNLSERAFLYAGIDHFIAMMPPSYMPEGKNAHLGFKVTVHPGPVRTVEVGLVAQRFIHAMHRSIKTMLDQGFNVILDEVLISKEDFDDYLNLFKGVHVLFVSINPPLEITEQREKARGYREHGFARGFYAHVHQGKTYDLEIDSSKSTPEQSAKQILDYLFSHSTLTAFESHQTS